MNKKFALILLLLIPSLSVAESHSEEARQRAVREIIQESISRYPGNCPCPYNLAANGSRCGKRSAYSRQGGYGPICYAEDVDERMIEQHLSSKGH
ncbi:hypothetical protein DMO17_18760 [Aquipseudomonas alcaligenes]|uniref:Uncharacterized protein n=1 Tax=Aquipseudomonas alcaligenes TaxID=43263 RepID=A0A2V4L5X8_AQUAC|nr:hypothetical protein DMO17_18760 [Pseudomonas alcaligenes]